MARPWMPFYVGDYLRKTAHLSTEQHGAYMLLIFHCWEHEHLPADAAGRAAIARVTLKRWMVIGPAVEAFFNPDGTHHRVEEERVKSEKALMQRRIAGSKGGMNASIARARAVADATARARPVATADATAAAQAEQQRTLKPPRTNHNSNITTTSFSAARDESDPGPIPPFLRRDESGLPMGASGKSPSQVAGSELVAAIERRAKARGSAA